jgi:ribose transport system substrate-binding protein
MTKRKGLQYAALLSALALIVAACGGDEGGGDGDGETYTIGVSNTLVGNGWREQMICSIKAQATASGVVDEVVVINENADMTGQIGHIENLISQGVDAIILNPTDREGLNSVIEEAINQGIVVVAVDQAVTAEGAYVATNDQEEYGYLGAKWLFEELGGEGDVVYMRGIDGVPADTDRDAGFQRALEEFPGITVVQETFTGWDPTVGAEQALNIITTQQVDGIWTSGIDYTVVEQFQSADVPFVPIVGADNNGFIEQLIELEGDGLTGAAVTNPPAIGAVGTAIAVDALEGDSPDQTTTLTPEVFDSSEQDQLDELYAPDEQVGWSTYTNIEPYTSYDAGAVSACTGPGETES